MAQLLLQQQVCCRNAGLHRKLACLRKPIVPTIGGYKFIRTVSFALQVGIGLK
jgi:hypothetical protein